VKKIPSLFARTADGQSLSRDYHPKADWVVRGEGVATRKWDGTAVMIKGGRLYARFDTKGGKPTPPDFIPCQEPDPITYHHPGWVPATRPEDKWIRAAAGIVPDALGYNLDLPDGTYEAVGPKIGGNPEGLTEHRLIPHGANVVIGAPRDFDGLKAWLAGCSMEGLVWWRDPHDMDCDKVKLTAHNMGVDRADK
jgi:hypothetical protein